MKSQLVELKERNTVRVEKRYEIHTNGHDNAYPTRMERLINASPTAKACAKAMAKFIIGGGFNVAFPDETYIGKNQDGKLTPNDALKESGYSLAYHKAFALHLNYNLNADISSITPMPYPHCRYGLADSEGFKGKIIVYDNWENSNGKGVKKDDFVIFDVFNPNKETVLKQMEAAGGIQNYRGQVLIVKMENTIYPLSTIDAAQDDADTDYKFSLTRNRAVNKGFRGKKIVVTDIMGDADLEQFQSDLKGIQGADSKGDILHLMTDYTSEDKKKKIDVQSLDDANSAVIMDSEEKAVSNNIRRCFNSIPQILIDVVDGGIFGQSGEAFKMSQAFYNSQTSEEREIVSSTFKKLFSYYAYPINPGNDWTIIPLEIIADAPVDSANKAILDAQAQLRGSVGGVTSLIEIQSSISQGTTSYESGVAMLKYMYGYEDAIAREILGQPKVQPNAPVN